MKRRTFLAALLASAATGFVTRADHAEAGPAVECYDAEGYLVECPPQGVPLPVGIVRRRIRRRRRVRRRVRRRIRRKLRG